MWSSHSSTASLSISWVYLIRMAQRSHMSKSENREFTHANHRFAIVPPRAPTVYFNQVWLDTQTWKWQPQGGNLHSEKQAQHTTLRSSTQQHREAHSRANRKQKGGGNRTRTFLLWFPWEGIKRAEWKELDLANLSNVSGPGWHNGYLPPLAVI